MAIGSPVAAKRLSNSRSSAGGSEGDVEVVGAAALAAAVAYFSASWTAFQADRGRDFSGIVDGVSV